MAIQRVVVVVEAVRSAVGKRGGSLGLTHPVDILGPVQMAAVRRAGIDPTVVGQVVGGCPGQGGALAGNIARTAWLAHGGPQSVAGSTVASACGSSQQAFNLAAALVGSGAEDVVLACGIDNMSMVPLGSAAFDCAAAGHGEPYTDSYRDRYEMTSQFEGAERIARAYDVSRAAADELGLQSQLRARAAVDAGTFTDQIVEVVAVTARSDVDSGSLPFMVDEVLRDTSLEKLAALPPVVGDDGIHTAGTSSQIADGASAVLVMSEDRAAELGVQPRARVLATCLVGCDPVLMLEGPIPATERLLDDTGLSINDIDVFEVNEAFASVVLAWERSVKADMDRVNPNGGAIAIGHPLGATGCVLVTKALHELERADAELALVTMCCGGGLGTGTILQRVGVGDRGHA